MDELTPLERYVKTEEGRGFDIKTMAHFFREIVEKVNDEIVDKSIKIMDEAFAELIQEDYTELQKVKTYLDKISVIKMYYCYMENPDEVLEKTFTHNEYVNDFIEILREKECPTFWMDAFDENKNELFSIRNLDGYYDWDCYVEKNTHIDIVRLSLMEALDFIFDTGNDYVLK
jgi:hypothetical protein